MDVWFGLIVFLAVWSAYSVGRGLWSLCAPRSAWRWERGAEFKGAEPSLVGVLMQLGRGMRRLVVGVLLGGAVYALIQFLYGPPSAMP
jgi:hypothetical protein